MTRTSLGLTPALQEYVNAHSEQPDEVLSDLAAETERLYSEEIVGMQIAPEQGAFMTLLARITGARDAVEIGTFTGYSAICTARGLASGGRLLALDISDDWTRVARRYFTRAGLDDTIELRIGPALEALRALPAEPRFDLAFIDADKEGYVDYWEELLPRMRPGATLLADNTLSHGRVVHAEEDSPAVKGIRAFNAHVHDDPRVEAVLLPLSDGLTIARKR